MKRKVYLDIAKIAACLAVIIQHNVSLGIEGKEIWFVQYFYYYICRFAVPVFVMCTGALMLDENKTVSYGVIIKKYIPRVFVPLIAIVYVIELTNAVTAGNISTQLLYVPLVHVIFNKVSVYIYSICDGGR